MAAFVVVIIGVLAVLVWTGWLAWDAADQIASRLSAERMRTFRLGDTFGADLHELRSHFRRYEASRDETHWSMFLAGSRRVDEDLLAQGKLASPAEQQAMASLRTHLAEYVVATARVHDGLQAGASRDTLAGSFAELGDLATDMAADLRQLVSLRQAVLEENLDAARTRFSRLVAIAGGTFCIAITLVAVLGTMVWHGLVQGLRRRLTASEDIARRNERLAALGVLAAGLAHEVRNPLTAIKARLYIQQRCLPPDSPAMEHARIIDREINRLEGTVRTVLSFARPSPPEPTDLDPSRILHQVQQLVLEDCSRQDIQLDVDCPIPVAIRADASQIHQVVLNLVRNAIEAVGRGGHIHLRTRPAPHRLGSAPTPGVLIEVEDDGPGISPEVQERLFDPFFTTKAHGTGLGLAISARIVAGNGGVLEFATRSGRGSIFSAAFPSVS